MLDQAVTSTSAARTGSNGGSNGGRSDISTVDLRGRLKDGADVVLPVRKRELKIGNCVLGTYKDTSSKTNAQSPRLFDMLRIGELRKIAYDCAAEGVISTYDSAKRLFQCALPHLARGGDLVGFARDYAP